MKLWFSCLYPPPQTTSDDEFKPSGHSLQGFRVFSLKELKQATGDFQLSNKIGEGGFGCVYKGHLQDGTVVAVKVLSIELESLRGEREFISEITALSDVKHQNLVSLRGCCISGTDRYVVYDYMENGSLAQAFLGGDESRSRFDWEMRKNISLGIARGIAFLHSETVPHIVHRDIKPANILLDMNFVPKIADFGLSKLFITDTSHISTRVAGTLGYLAQEYAITGHLTRKSDVYSYGVLLLQMVSGSSVVDFDLEHGETYLVNKAWNEHNANNLRKLVDCTLKGEIPKEEAVKFLKIGLLCVQEQATLRPTMSAVVKMLTSEQSVGDYTISKPGCLSDLMHLKIGHNHSSDSNLSSPSPTTSYYGSI